MNANAKGFMILIGFGSKWMPRIAVWRKYKDQSSLYYKKGIKCMTKRMQCIDMSIVIN